MQTIFAFCLFCLWGVAAQNVRVESLSQQPACSNQLLAYNCRVEFPSLIIRWRHDAFGLLVFLPNEEEVGSMMNTSDGRVIANLTMNDGTGTFRMVASTLTIQPPLNDLNGTNLNGTDLTCEGVDSFASFRSGIATIMLAGKPSPPDNLHTAAPDDMPYTRVMWDPPVYPEHKYKIRIPEIYYSEEEDGTARTHTITGGSDGVMFNTPYEVEVTAVDKCENESNPAIITVNIEAGAPPLLTSLGTTLQCSDGNILKADIHWEYGTESSSVYTPPIETVTVEVDGPAPISANGCSDLTPSDMNCSFNITEGGLYMVRLNTTNEIGTTPNENTFSFAPLSVNYSRLTSEDSPGITATINSLCAEPFNHFFVGVLFGIKKIGGTDCRYMQRRTMLFTDSRTVFVPLDTDVVIIPAHQAADYEYCAKATLNEELCDVCRSEDESKEEGFSAGAASGITLVLTLLLTLPLGILIGCCVRGSLCRRQATDSNSGKPQQSVGAIYEEPGPVEAAIPLSENLTYGHVQGQRRN